MGNKICFLFGNSTTPYEALPWIEQAAERHYLELGIRTFVIGNRGNFDSYAATAIKSLKRKHRDISLVLLLAYHPGERPFELPAGFDSSYYPPLENVPRKYAIVRTNKYMIDTADSIICYAKFAGNCKELLEYAKRHCKINNTFVEDISDFKMQETS